MNQVIYSRRAQQTPQSQGPQDQGSQNEEQTRVITKSKHDNQSLEQFSPIQMMQSIETAGSRFQQLPPTIPQGRQSSKLNRSNSTIEMNNSFLLQTMKVPLKPSNAQIERQIKELVKKRGQNLNREFIHSIFDNKNSLSNVRDVLKRTVGNTSVEKYSSRSLSLP